ncbi:CubicO group peptidase, beta-lactamase class C family [Pseudomonas antarctica]|uniref:CubicO group peptidase, beta-lactamase class C family n=1 Tax=Pseudomonas antarctica TaxID=219572 RepID=A0A1H0AZ88_9PSED|nr:serine hydrolase domain-containing protein [Pseudomonas antarctica]KAF2407612.1 D-alanyl-D-alanine-carboxypeptidase/endopeptidase AmpH precursor [Pseudomonas antarctica]SDN38755.1 CubicO group peptidase, beta-lactamase class C family [Pseudomonas antarctica]
MFRTLRGIALLGCLLGSLGCHGQPPAPPPIPKGDYGAIIRYLQARIPKEMARENVPGLSIALVNGQELIWARGFGMADKAQGVPVTPNTAFRAGGISKLLTATAALQLVEQQRLALDAPIQQTLREFYVRSRFHSDPGAADRDITLRRLLSHQSGLPSEHLRDLRSTYAMGQMPMRVSGVWLSSPPRSQVAYSNLAYSLVGAAIERVSNKSFEAQMQTSLLKPLEMGQSSFVGTGTQLSFRALGYEDGVVSTDAQVRDLAAAGLWASPKDLIHYVQMLFAQGLYKGNRVLGSLSIDAMFTQQNTGNALDFDCQMGLGWFLAPCGDEPVGPGVRTYQHSGGGDDFAAQLSVLPDQQLAVIIMANDSNAEELVASLATDALRLMLQAQTGEAVCADDCQAPNHGLKLRHVPAAVDRKRLAGFYATAWGVFRIKDENNRLAGELAGFDFELLRDDSGWLRAQKKRLGVWFKDLGDLGRVQLNVITVQGRQMLTARSHGQRIAIGERIDPPPLPQAWADTIGTYQVLNTHEPDAPLSGISVRLEEGFLVIRGHLHDEPLTDYILLPVDNAHAVLAGNGYGLGDTVSRQVNGLSASGYAFKRTNAPHNRLNF